MRRTMGGASGRILEVASDRFAERGYRATSIEEIAAGAEISRSSLFWHFGSKDGLLRAVIEESAGLWLQGIHNAESDRRGLEAIRAALAEIRRLHTEQPSVARLMTVLVGEAASTEPSLAPIFIEIERDMLDFFARSLSEAAEDGDLHPGLDPRAAAHVLVGSLLGMKQLWVLDPESFDISTLDDALLHVVECLYGSCQSQPKQVGSGARSGASARTQQRRKRTPGR